MTSIEVHVPLVLLTDEVIIRLHVIQNHKDGLVNKILNFDKTWTKYMKKKGLSNNKSLPCGLANISLGMS